MRKGMMLAEEGTCHAANCLAGLTDAAALGGLGCHDDHCLKAGRVHSGQCGEDSRERIGNIAIEGVVELYIAANGKEIGVESQFHRPRLEPGRRRLPFCKAFHGGGRVVGRELRGYRHGEFRGNSATNRDGSSLEAEAELDRQPTGIGLMNGSQGLLHVLRPAVVVRWNAECEEHGRRIAWRRCQTVLYALRNELCSLRWLRCIAWFLGVKNDAGRFAIGHKLVPSEKDIAARFASHTKIVDFARPLEVRPIAAIEWFLVGFVGGEIPRFVTRTL